MNEEKQNSGVRSQEPEGGRRNPRERQADKLPVNLYIIAVDMLTSARAAANTVVWCRQQYRVTGSHTLLARAEEYKLLARGLGEMLNRRFPVAKGGRA